MTEVMLVFIELCSIIAVGIVSFVAFCYFYNKYANYSDQEKNRFMGWISILVFSVGVTFSILNYFKTPSTTPIVDTVKNAPVHSDSPAGNIPKVYDGSGNEHRCIPMDEKTLVCQ